MPISSWLRLTITVSVLCTGSGAPVRAVASGDDAATETMVVTAHRTPVLLPDAGSAISVIDRAHIEARQSAFVTDLLRDLPGVAVSQTSGRGTQTQVRIRGAEANHVLVLIDGVKVNDPTGADEFNFGALTAYDIERIELVRGPQSALWGSEATAGMITITTRRSDRPLAADGFLETGSFATVAGGGSLSASSRLGSLNLNASWHETDGVSAAAAGSEKDGYENLTLGATGTVAPGGSARLGFAVRYTEDRLAYDGTDFSTGLPIDADNQTDKEILLAAVDGGITALNGRWDTTLKFTYLDTASREFNDGVPGSNFTAEKLGSYFQTSALLGPTAQVQRHRLTFAADYEDETYRQRTAFASQDQSLDNAGVALEYLTNPARGLNLSVSVRYDANSEFENVTTYRGTSSWLFERTGTRLKASVGTGQKRPTFTERFGFSPDQFVGNPGLEPERNEGFDLGLSQTLLNARVRIEATYFSETLVDEITTVFEPASFLSTTVNLDGKSRRRGVELEALAYLGELTLSANYTRTDATQPSNSNGRQREPRRPRHMGAINLNHGFDDARGNVNLNISYTGASTDTIFPPPSFAAETVRLAPYTLVNLAGDWRATDWLTLFARAENLFDQGYQDVFGFGTPGLGFYAGFRIGGG